MSKQVIDALIKEASLCPAKLTETKDFKQVWFTRPEMERLVQLIALSCMELCSEVRDNASIVDPKDPERTRDPEMIDGICMGANKAKYNIMTTFGIGLEYYDKVRTEST